MPFNTNPLAGNYASKELLNNNFDAIDEEINDNVLHRKLPVGRESDANQMEIDLDMNSNAVNNASSVQTASFTLGTDEPVTSRSELLGPVGPQGIQGVQGNIGPEGPQGIQGTTGAQGVQGDQGIEGPQGIQGLEGPQGIQGIQGPIGVIGPQGIQGEQGVVGPQGGDGTSYTIDDVLPDYNSFRTLTGTIADKHSYLVQNYCAPTIASLSSGSATIRIANPTPIAGHTFSAISVSSATTGGLGYLGWLTASSGRMDLQAGTVVGDYMDFTLSFGAQLPTTSYVIIEAVATGVPWFEQNNHDFFYIIYVGDHLAAFDGAGTQESPVVASHLFIKEGAGNASTYPSGTVPVGDPTPLDDAWYDDILFGTGPTGPQGPEGIQGPQGLQGVVGVQGEQGVQGTIGDQGPTGAAGADGADGSQGIRGSRSYYSSGVTSWTTATAIAEIPSTPLENDISTQFDNASGFSESRIFNGGTASNATNWTIVDKMVNNEPVVVGGVDWSWRGVNSFALGGSYIWEDTLEDENTNLSWDALSGTNNSPSDNFLYKPAMDGRTPAFDQLSAAHVRMPVRVTAFDGNAADNISHTIARIGFGKHPSGLAGQIVSATTPIVGIDVVDGAIYFRVVDYLGTIVNYTQVGSVLNGATFLVELSIHANGDAVCSVDGGSKTTVSSSINFFDPSYQQYTYIGWACGGDVTKNAFSDVSIRTGASIFMVVP